MRGPLCWWLAAERLTTPPEDFASFLIAALDGLIIQWLVASEDTPTGTELVTALTDTIGLVIELDDERRRSS